MQLSTHFNLEELIFSETAIRHNIDNTPSYEVLANLKVLASHLEDVRNVLGNPMRISSGYRSPVVNSLVGSKPTSAHIKGLAADFTCPNFGSVRDIVHAIIGSDIQYDQVIYEFDSWCHIGFAEAGKTPRLQKLIIDHNGTRAFS